MINFSQIDPLAGAGRRGCPLMLEWSSQGAGRGGGAARAATLNERELGGQMERQKENDQTGMVDQIVVKNK